MTTTYNNFKSTTVRGIFNNSDYADGSVLASATFDRDLTVKNNLYIGMTTTNYDASGNIIGYTDSGGNINFSINNVSYTITPTILRSILLNNTFTGNTIITNATNSKTLTIKPGFNGSTLSTSSITFESSSASDTNYFTGNINCNQLSTINGCTLGNGNDLSRARRNFNVDNVLRIGYNDATDVGALLSNNSNLDINGNIYLTGVINSSTGSYATQTYVNTAISNLVASSPTTLDTLSELATALGNDPNFATTITTLIGTKTTLSAVQSNNNAWTGTNTFNNSIPTSTLTPTLSSQFITKAYADSTYSSSGSGTMLLSLNNTWSGTNTFNSSLPTSTLTPTNTSDLTTKAYVDSQVSTKPSLSTIQSNNNTWSGTNTFNSSLPTSTLTPTNTSDLTTKAYVDSQVGNKTTLSEIQSNNNTWSGTNTFNTSLPTSTLTPTLNGELTTKSYVDSQVGTKTTLSAIQSNNNTWSGTNTFNSSLPTSTLTPTLNGELTTKSYVDSQVGIKPSLSSIQANNNTWTGTNTFNTSLPTSTLTPTLSSELITKSYGDSTYTTLSAVQANANTFSNTTTFTGNITANATSITPTALGYVSGLTANAQAQLNNRVTLNGIQTISGVKTFTGNIVANSNTITPTAFGYISGLTSDAQTQINSKTTLSAVQANNNTWTGTNSFSAGLSTGGVTSFYNGNLIVNAGATYAAKNINMYGVNTLYIDSASGGNGITSLYRDLTTKNFYIDSSYFDNSVGGGVVFRLKNPNGTAGNYSDVLSVQPLSMTINQPLTLNSTLNGISTSTLSYLDATSSIQNQFNNIGTTLTGISYDSVQDITTINNHVVLPSGNNLYLGTGYNVKTNLDDCITKLSGITYTSGTDTTTIDNNVVITGSIKNYYGVYKDKVLKLQGTFQILGFPLEEYIIFDLTGFTYASPYNLTLPTISTSNYGAKITVILQNQTSNIKIMPPASTSLYDDNLATITEFRLSRNGYISVTFMASSIGWSIIDYTTNSYYGNFSSISTTDLYMYGNITVSSFTNPSSGAQIGYTMSGSNNVSFSGTSYYTPTSFCTIAIPSFGVWMLTLKFRVSSTTNNNSCYYHCGFAASTSGNFLNVTGSLYAVAPIALNLYQHFETSFTTVQSFYQGITFGTTTFSTAPFNIYTSFSAYWTSANTGTMYHWWQCTRIA